MPCLGFFIWYGSFCDTGVRPMFCPMKSKVTFLVLALGVLALTVLFVIKQERGARLRSPTAASAGSTDASSAALQAAPEIPKQTAKTVNPSQPTEIQTEAAPDSPEAKHQAYVEARVAELGDLAMEDDQASLDTILSELTNRDPEIRKAALEASIQFGSRDAIPKLADAASQIDDPKERAAIEEAIAFLKLPSLTEVLAESKSAPAGIPCR